MYPKCRHIRPNGATCQSPALAKSHWCYYHTRLHQRQAERRHRLANGRFATLPEIAGETIDYGTYPVSVPHPGASPEQQYALDLPPLEDAASIQLALIDVLQALAANQLNPKRAGLLLYGLQVASANAKNVRTETYGAIRDHTETEDGTPLARQRYGRDDEDDDEDDEDEEDGD